jgi:hypothetical protein
VPGAAREAGDLLASDEVARERLRRVSRLVEGFETPFGLELIATVHWVAVHEQATTEEAAERATYAWGKRKAQFTKRQIDRAFDRIRTEGVPCFGCKPGVRPDLLAGASRGDLEQLAARLVPDKR